MADSEDPKELIGKIECAIQQENQQAINRFCNYLHNRHDKSFLDKIIEETDADLLDFESKGKDISKKEFIDNEIFFDCN